MVNISYLKIKNRWLANKYFSFKLYKNNSDAKEAIKYFIYTSGNKNYKYFNLYIRLLVIKLNNEY